MAIIRTGTLASSLRSVLDPHGSTQIDWTAPVSDYIAGGDGAIAAFASALNRSEEFRGYRLALGPRDLSQCEIIRDVLEAIIMWFKDHGWTVVL